jgi:SAM-dependent methyltransferase
MWTPRAMWLAAGAKGHLDYAARRGAPGVEFGYFGRSLGWRLARSGALWGLGWVANPVSIVRYFEFDFARRCLEDARGRFLDLGSPRLFSLWMANRKAGHITMLNPDARDVARSREAAHRLGLRDIEFDVAGADVLASRPERYDAIWSLSVLEHIEGAYDERVVLRLAWDALVPGGRLVITVPAAPAFAVETRPSDPYGTQPPLPDGSYFFQRIYDKKSIDSRLTGTLNTPPQREEYFGEHVPGTYAAYEARWMERGIEATVADPRLIADQFERFESHEAMPGLGVAALCYVKPGSTRS